MMIVPAANTQNRRIFKVSDIFLNKSLVTVLFYGNCSLSDAIVMRSDELFRMYRPNLNMNSASTIITFALGLILSVSTTSSADTGDAIEPESMANSIQAFPYQSLELWQEESFVGNTHYELFNDAGTTVLKATASNTASVLYRKDAIDLTSTPVLEWFWKIESTYSDIDEPTKAGDDFPARLYVTAKTGAFPWQVVAINYVWSSNQPIGSIWVNPYTKKSTMVAVQGGKSKVGQWVSQRRNVVEDFKQLFNIDVKKLAGYAVMVDGDNSSQSGTAYFGNIEFVAN